MIIIQEVYEPNHRCKYSTYKVTHRSGYFFRLSVNKNAKVIPVRTSNREIYQKIFVQKVSRA